MTFDVMIEIPRGSRNKYEIDEKTGRIRYDRMLHSSMQYPADYGFVPDTLALDGDALDVLVLVTEPTFPGCFIEVRTIGVFRMLDQGEQDDKLICVPVSDPIWCKIANIEELNPHITKEIEHFFKVYKDLENKSVISQGFNNREAAERLLKECLERYKE